MKRIVICSDGTWGSPMSPTPSNVVKAARAVLPVSSESVEQVVFYDWGIGTEVGQALTGGILGRGIDKNICDAYRFLIHNYSEGDEIYLFGFSRGAYTVRSLVGLIRNCGVLPKYLSHKVTEAYSLYRSNLAVDSEEARLFRDDTYPVNVKFLGVWDTVGALGLPVKLFLRDKYDFHDTSLSRIVENAYHALAMDEVRKSYSPTLWKTAKTRKNTEQRWFRGHHSDIGGGSDSTGISNTTFHWIMDKAKVAGLEVDTVYMFDKTPYLQEVTRKFNVVDLLGRRKRRYLTTNHDERLNTVK